MLENKRVFPLFAGNGEIDIVLNKLSTYLFYRKNLDKITEKIFVDEIVKTAYRIKGYKPENLRIITALKSLKLTDENKGHEAIKISVLNELFQIVEQALLPKYFLAPRNRLK